MISHQRVPGKIPFFQFFSQKFPFFQFQKSKLQYSGRTTKYACNFFSNWKTSIVQLLCADTLLLQSLDIHFFEKWESVQLRQFA